MNRRVFHFRPTLDVEKLQQAAAAFFQVSPAHVFVYFDATDILGSDKRDPDPVQAAAFDAAAVRILVRRFEPGTGPLEGWLSLDLANPAEFDDAALCQALAPGAGVAFYYVDPVPDLDDEPAIGAAQIEVAPDGTTRHVWLTEYGDEGQTRTDVSGRGADEDQEE